MLFVCRLLVVILIWHDSWVVFGGCCLFIIRLFLVGVFIFLYRSLSVVMMMMMMMMMMMLTLRFPCFTPSSPPFLSNMPCIPYAPGLAPGYMAWVVLWMPTPEPGKQQDHHWAGRWNMSLRLFEHFWNTPLNLYQQAMEFLSWLAGELPFLVCDIGVWHVNFRVNSKGSLNCQLFDYTQHKQDTLGNIYYLVGLGEPLVSSIKRGICKSNTSENLGQGIQASLNLYYMPMKMRHVSKLSVDISSDPEQIHGFPTFNQPIFRISACLSLSHHHASAYTICLTCDISQTSNSLIVALGGFHTPMLPLGAVKNHLILVCIPDIQVFYTRHPDLPPNNP